MGELSAKTCVPCRKGAPALTDAQVKELLPQVPQWRLGKKGDRIARTFTFDEFAPAMAFVNKVADLAEREGHHPDFKIHYNEVELVLWTHAIGGLHENDFVMAAKIDRLP
jgi:4a-hydroxytetrahydrobiopterin dehydratase